MDGFDHGMGTYPPRLRRDRGVGPWGNSRPALTPETAANQQAASGTRVYPPCGVVSPGEILLYGSELMELYRY